MRTRTAFLPGGTGSSRVGWVDSFQSLPAVLQRLELPGPTAVLILIGGASKMSDTELESQLALFDEAVVPVCAELGVTVVDGGTDAGVMGSMGRASVHATRAIPLVGVAPAALVDVPGEPTDETERERLEPNHQFFVLVPGGAWGDESPWLTAVGLVIADGMPVLELLVNGGEISKMDVTQAISAGVPVIAVDGTGRTADELARALVGETKGEWAETPSRSGLVISVPLDLAVLRAALIRGLTTREG